MSNNDLAEAIFADLCESDEVTCAPSLLCDCHVATGQSVMLRVLDLFSGIGGFSLGLERTGGFQTVAFCEIDPFGRQVLAKHWPAVPCHDDVTTREFVRGEADVVVGGFPCQDVSHAGKRAGLSGERSGLYRELVRALRLVRPKHAIVENVAALLGNGMGVVLGDVAESGFDAEWDCVPAKALGAPHERDRVWIVAHAHCERCGEAWGFRHRSEQVSPGRTEAAQSADAACIGCGQGRTWRPADSFARVRDATRWNATYPASAGLEGREQSEASRRAQPIPACGYSNPWRRWTDEPEIQGVDDGFPNWVDSTRATGNAVIPQIPELIGQALLQQRGIKSASGTLNTNGESKNG